MRVFNNLFIFLYKSIAAEILMIDYKVLPQIQL